MTAKSVTLLLASALVLGSAMPALAQARDPAEVQYQRQMENYQDRRATYNDQSSDYAAQQADYERQRADYEQARRDYDQRYGSGSYDRRYPNEATRWAAPYASGYGPDAADDAQRRAYERERADYERARRNYDRRYGDGSYERRYPDDATRYAAPYAGNYGANASYGDPCRDNARTNAVAGGVIGALAGAAVGSNVAGRNARPEGAVLGALVGGGIGAGIGKASAKCDTRGRYYGYDETVPYRESADYLTRPNGRTEYSAYDRRRCRLAPAAAEYGGATDYRYVRVCPDADGRYRVTD